MLEVYVDGSGGPNSGYGYFVRDTGRSFYRKAPGLTNNQAEYMAVIAALTDICDDMKIRSDSKLVVSQIRHEFAINSEPLREMARQVWEMASGRNILFEWVPRGQNLAGKMLGS